ncbi:hypothetical protein EVAR_56021_1 [Eumeta japonica]|uniref:Uncharacterized protein n=1 Tax=Eumeta variegata TaxID=151549 RepID=A0A4C1YNC5_EUMVA|nr:hypothetical protein EVAR_56021_1 [Eumeta japonica]
MKVSVLKETRIRTFPRDCRIKISNTPDGPAHDDFKPRPAKSRRARPPPAARAATPASRLPYTLIPRPPSTKHECSPQSWNSAIAGIHTEPRPGLNPSCLNTIQYELRKQIKGHNLDIRFTYVSTLRRIILNSSKICTSISAADFGEKKITFEELSTVFYQTKAVLTLQWSRT